MARWLGPLLLWTVAAQSPAPDPPVVLKGHEDAVNGVVFHPSGKWIVSASSDDTVKVWSVAERLCTDTLKGHTDAVNAIAFSKDGNWLASASTDQTIRIWNFAEKKEAK